MGKVVVPIGPQHPALKEPQSFSITLNGEKILEMDVRLGYNHRGIEKACEAGSYIQNLYLIERICGICSHAHSDNFVRAVEEIGGVDVPKRAQYIRGVIGELERIHSHLLWLGVAGHEIGFDTLLMYAWRDREAVMDLLAQLTGNRVNYSINTLGGVRRDITKEQADDILKVVKTLEERTKYYAQLAAEETTVIERLSGVGYLSQESVLKLGTVGPTGRASGVARDVRRDDPYGAYEDVSFKVITDDHCDVYGRTLVRVGELMESYSIIRQFLQKMPDGPVSVRVPRMLKGGEAVTRYEAPRGELIHYVKNAEKSDKPQRVRVRAPTLANVTSVPAMLNNNTLADVPITIAAIDPCFSCTDRMIRVNHAAGGGGLVSWGELREYSLDWYRQRGIDFAASGVSARFAAQMEKCG